MKDLKSSEVSVVSGGYYYGRKCQGFVEHTFGGAAAGIVLAAWQGFDMVKGMGYGAAFGAAYAVLDIVAFNLDYYS